MDPVTHGLTGILISRGFRSKKGVVGVLLTSSLLPDIDYITRLWGADVFLRYHRGITHGFLAALLLPAAVALLFRRIYSRGGFYYFVAASLGYTTHLLMDLTTQYPMRLFAPLDWEGYSLDLMFIIDPYVTGSIILGIILSLRKTSRRRLIVGVVLIFLILYSGARWYLKSMAEEFLRTQLDEYHYRLCPLPNDFLRWWFVVRSSNTYKVGFVDLFSRSICIKGVYRYTEEEPEISESKVLRVVRNFLYFAKAPYAELIEEGDRRVVKWRELSYAFLPGEHFVATVRFDRLGRVEDAFFRY